MKDVCGGCCPVCTPNTCKDCPSCVCYGLASPNELRAAVVRLHNLFGAALSTLESLRPLANAARDIEELFGKDGGCPVAVSDGELAGRILALRQALVGVPDGRSAYYRYEDASST